ncbi:MAG: tRNA (guanosine(46)-N7)-methyltransferase TrmB [Gammaproteobacteria bacterium]|nr:tRNA (guanosine(46)-N7)-methyltransferase TrmB [Gammaproteobacteria bacterium]
MLQPEKKHRPIRSFVLREGRLTKGQEKAFETIWPEYGIDFEGKPLDLPTIFGNRNPVYLEIGFGNGDSLARMAQANPDRNYLGIEVHRPGVGHLLIKIEALGLTNLRLMRHDGVEVMKLGITDGALAGAYLFFPDPWHKKRHNKRRILNPEFVTELARTIHSGGQFHAATDWDEYAQQMLQVLEASGPFENTAGTGNFTPRPAERPLTKFEQRGERLGHGVWDLIFKRK